MTCMTNSWQQHFKNWQLFVYQLKEGKLKIEKGNNKLKKFTEFLKWLFLLCHMLKCRCLQCTSIASNWTSNTGDQIKNHEPPARRFVSMHWSNVWCYSQVPHLPTQVLTCPLRWLSQSNVGRSCHVKAASAHGHSWLHLRSPFYFYHWLFLKEETLPKQKGHVNQFARKAKQT